MQPVSASDEITERFAQLISLAVPVEDGVMPATKVFDELDSHHYELWTAARRRHLEKTQQIARYRLASLETSHRARLALLNEQLTKATDERIRRMRQSQLSSAEADFRRRGEEIQRAIGEADITAQPIAFGILRITH